MCAALFALLLVSLLQEADRCAVCFSKASVRCDRCDDEFYCGIRHRKRHARCHKDACFPKGSAAPTADAEGQQPSPVEQVSCELGGTTKKKKLDTEIHGQS